MVCEKTYKRQRRILAAFALLVIIASAYVVASSLTKPVAANPVYLAGACECNCDRIQEHYYKPGAI